MDKEKMKRCLSNEDGSPAPEYYEWLKTVNIGDKVMMGNFGTEMDAVKIIVEIHEDEPDAHFILAGLDKDEEKYKELERYKTIWCDAKGQEVRFEGEGRPWAPCDKTRWMYPYTDDNVKRIMIALFDKINWYYLSSHPKIICKIYDVIEDVVDDLILNNEYCQSEIKAVKDWMNLKK